MPSFAELSRDFLQEEYAESPTTASRLGLTEYDERLEDLSAEAFERRNRRAAEWLGRFEALDGELTPDDEIDLELVRSTLRGRLVLADWEGWRRQPDTYLNPGLSGIFTLFLHRLRAEPELVDAAIARLAALPDNLADARRNLRPELVPAVFVQRAIGQARAGARYTGELLPAEIGDPTLATRLSEAGTAAAAALEDYARFLEELRERATGEWALGEARYTALLRDKELLSLDARALRERGRSEYDRLAAELARIARELEGTDDWVRVLARLNEDRPPTPEAMREEYERWTAAAREFLRERRLVSFPEGEECAVVPSPHFQRPVLAVASYQSPPAFAPSMKGHFFVPFPPDGTPPEEVAKRLEANSYPGIPTTAVHEAYPGHHWHLVVAKGNPSEVRALLGTPYFSEGWALYAEQLMREEGFFADLRHEMFQYEATIFRAARIVVDTSLHMGEMSYEDAVTFMMERANLPEPTARAEVTRYCAWPTQASAYLTGCLEILRIRDRYLAEAGGRSPDTLRAFHDSLAASGKLPIALAERAVMAELGRAS